MSRIVLACPEPLGHGQPAGVGIRFLEMARALLSDGHAVMILSPDAGEVPGCSSAPLTPETVTAATPGADAVVVQGHAANTLFAHGQPVPTVVDLYDPFIIENLHYYPERGAEVFTHDHATLMQSLVRGDFFLCASHAQRLFYLGLLLAAGRLNPQIFDTDPQLHQLLAVAPFGVQPPRPLPPRSGHNVLFGGIYDWYDPILAIEAIAIARRTIDDLTLTFTRHPNPDLTPQGRTAEAIAHVRRRGYGDFIRFEPWFAYERRGEFLDRFVLALLTFPQTVETELSMRTRVYDYLWGGIPVISSPAPGTDVLLNRYGAGRIVNAASAEAFAGEVVRVLRDRQSYQQMVSGTRAFVSDHQWSRTLAPLLAFCRSPRMERSKDSFAVQLHVPERPASILNRLRRRIGGSF